jgi:hypothetical protein
MIIWSRGRAFLHVRHVGHDRVVDVVIWPITDEGVAVGGAFGSDTATGMMPAAHRVAGVLAFQ